MLEVGSLLLVSVLILGFSNNATIIFFYHQHRDQFAHWTEFDAFSRFVSSQSCICYAVLGSRSHWSWLDY